MASLTQSCFATHDGIRLHYVVAGEGDILLFLHGIPDFWKGWCHQLHTLRAYYRVAAMDLRGFNRSDKPTDVRAYRLTELIADVLAVLRDLGGAPATIVGHDWGALLGWWIATLYPNLVARLAVLACAHPTCYLAARNAGELKYSQGFYDQILAAAPGAPFDADLLSTWISDERGRAELAAALRRSDPEAIRNYYRANLPVTRIEPVPSVKAPVLILYGLEDSFIPARYYDLSARHVAGPCEIVPIPNAGHYIHYESATPVTRELVRWLGIT